MMYKRISLLLAVFIIGTTANLSAQLKIKKEVDPKIQSELGSGYLI